MLKRRSRNHHSVCYEDGGRTMEMTTMPCLVLLLLMMTSVVDAWSSPFTSFGRNQLVRRGGSADENKNSKITNNIDYEFDLVIIGAGASGLFASGAATSLGCQTLLLDQQITNQPEQDDASILIQHNLGGDCTNAACVPSKAVRSVAQLSSSTTTTTWSTKRNFNWLSYARRHATDTIQTVRSREGTPQEMVERNHPHLNIVLLQKGYFTSPQTMELVVSASSSSRNSDGKRRMMYGPILENHRHNKTTTTTTLTISSKKFLIATGASPIIPPGLEQSAKEAGVPFYTYRTLFGQQAQASSSSDTDDSIWNLLNEDVNSSSMKKHVVIAGGGPSGVEIAQSLSRLGLQVTLVAPQLLPDHDASLRAAAQALLEDQEGVNLRLNAKVKSVTRDDKTLVLEEPTTNSNENSGDNHHHADDIPPVDALIACVGRSPAESLRSLRLKAAHIDYDDTLGVLVHPRTLKSTSNQHVSACGDCCSAVTARTSTHAAWTGYHAVLQTVLPFWLRLGSKAVHNTVPRVIYTDPELATVGLSHSECEAIYGRNNGFDSIRVNATGTDRADMDSVARNNATEIGFVELRVTKVDGRILGFTGCGPCASEHANEMSLAIASGLTVRDVAKALHSYPSHGYLLYRAALALALKDVWGSLEAIGPVGGGIATMGRGVTKVGLFVGRKMKSVRKIVGLGRSKENNQKKK